MSYPWTGNILELKNFIERIYILIPHVKIQPQHLIKAGLDVLKKDKDKMKEL